MQGQDRNTSEVGKMQTKGIEVVGASKSFGEFRALDDVSIKVAPGTVHALLGENGAGKSTLVKGLVGYGALDQGQILFGGREASIQTPRDAQALGIGMVYQHFTVAPGLSVEENLLLARGRLRWRLDWNAERRALAAFMRGMPFALPLDKPVAALAAGEKQKLEILKQLYLRQRFLILDEPTSVLTPQEAEQVLGLMRSMARRGDLTVLMITHKFHEVMAYADEVTVLRKGRNAGSSPVAATYPRQLAAWMMGAEREAVPADLSAVPGDIQRPRRASLAADIPARLQVQDLTVRNDKGVIAVDRVSLTVRPGEIVGLAGISGNGQKELMEALLGQRRPVGGLIAVSGRPYRASRREMTASRVAAIPEEPLKNACIASMSVAGNLALRDFDRAPMSRGWRIDRRAMHARAEGLITAFNVRPPAPQRPVSTLSGGNVQRAVLARELSAPVDLLMVANPVFGLDFASVADIHARLVAARDAGTAVLLVSEDLDELLELADRILVMTAGRIVFETDAATAQRVELGRHMAGHGQPLALDGMLAAPAQQTIGESA